MGHFARDCPNDGSSTSSSSAPSEPMPKYIDTHVHIDYILQKSRHKNFGDFRRASHFPANYEGSIAIFCDSAAFSPSLGTWQEQLGEDNVYGVFGMHPHNAKYYTDQVEERITECLKHPKAVAWGETGLDYHVMNSDKDTQKQVFARQILRAVELNKPIVVHSRNAGDDTYAILKDLLPPTHPVHVHCFTDSPEVAVKMIADFPNLFFGFTGVITYNDEALRGIVRDIVPIDRILLETDAPYLTPKGANSKVNHPGFIPLVAQAIATLKGIPIKEVYVVTRANTKRCYGI
jgi:TatD DNase family protein